MVRAAPLPEVWVLMATPVERRSTLAPPEVVVLIVVAVEPVRVAPAVVNWRVLELPLKVEPVPLLLSEREPEPAPPAAVRVAPVEVS